MFGLAGLAGGVNSLICNNPEIKTDELAINVLMTIGGNLLKRQHEKGYWTFEGRPCSGFAHGTSGIIAALAVISKNTRFHIDDAIERGIHFELNNLKDSYH